MRSSAKLAVALGVVALGASIWLYVAWSPPHGRPGESPELQRIRAELEETRPAREAAAGALEQQRQAGALGNPPPLRAEDVDTAAERIRYAARQSPPFGPQIIGLGASEAELLRYEKNHYESHSAEYERFVALWGDVHAMR